MKGGTMKHITRFRWALIPIFVVALIGVVFETTRQSEAEVEVSSEGSKEVVVTIGPPDRSVLSVGDSMRKVSKFRESIEEYRKVVSMEGVDARVKAEAQYNIGLSYVWLGNYKQVETEFKALKRDYPTNGTAIGWMEYCLAHLDISRGEYQSALFRCEAILEKKVAEDQKLYAFAQYQIGRISFHFLGDVEKGKAAFSKTVESYPDSEPARLAHLFLEDIRLLSQ
jgi:tetratricopeptide (TPR) repeat protein